jgi:hypothetical protein
MLIGELPQPWIIERCYRQNRLQNICILRALLFYFVYTYLYSLLFLFNIYAGRWHQQPTQRLLTQAYTLHCACRFHWCEFWIVLVRFKNDHFCAEFKSASSEMIPGNIYYVGEYCRVCGSLSPRHGAFSGCGWSNRLRCGGQLRINRISSREQPTRGWARR